MFDKKYVLLLTALCMTVCFTACTNPNAEVSKDVFAMDTFMNIRAYGEHAEDAVDRCEEEIKKLDTLFDAEKTGSEINTLNNEGEIVSSQDTYNIVNRAIQASEMTGGSFDITVYPIVKLWGFITDEYRVPEIDEIESALGYVDFENVKYYEGISGCGVNLPEGTEICLGGIAKGYTSDRMMEIFKEEGVRSGIVSLGGNVAVFGSKPDGSPWRVAIENPDIDSAIPALKNKDYVGVVEVSDKSVITSGGYERFFEKDGIRYHHIIDPATGYPADSGLISVSIVSSDGCLADALSTALFVMGKDKALECWRENSDIFDCILVETDGTVTITEGIENCFSTDGIAYDVFRQ